MRSLPSITHLSLLRLVMWSMFLSISLWRRGEGEKKQKNITLNITKICFVVENQHLHVGGL